MALDFPTSPTDGQLYPSSGTPQWIFILGKGWRRLGGTDIFVGSAPNLPIITGPDGILITGAFGSAANTFCQGNDVRLSDPRTPTAHTQAWSTITATPTTLSGYGITNAQPLDSDLTAIAALATTTYGRSLLTLTDVAANTAALDLFTSSLKGLVPASGGGTSTYLRADGTWVSPPAPVTFTSNTLTYAATVDLDLAVITGSHRTLTLTGDVTFTNSNLAAGRWVTLRIIPGASLRTFTFPAAWVFISDKPADIAANKTAILTLSYYGTTDADCIAAYKQQP